MESPSNGIYKAIPAIMAEIGAIAKDRKNDQQGYKFRGIDDVYNAVHPLLIKYKVFTVPNVLESVDTMETTTKGAQLHYARMTMEYKFCHEDGSFIIAKTRGEGMDSGDKASNKAMAVAHKYAIVQMFAIPTESGDDPENESHEIKGNGTVEIPKEREVPNRAKPGPDGERSFLRGQYMKLGKSKWLTDDDKAKLKEAMGALAKQDDGKASIKDITEVIGKYKEIADAMAEAAGEESYKEWIASLEAAVLTGEVEL